MFERMYEVRTLVAAAAATTRADKRNAEVREAMQKVSSAKAHQKEVVAQLQNDTLMQAARDDLVNELVLVTRLVVQREITLEAALTAYKDAKAKATRVVQMANDITPHKVLGKMKSMHLMKCVMASRKNKPEGDVSVVAELVVVLHRKTLHEVMSDIREHENSPEGSAQKNEHHNKKSRLLSMMYSVLESWPLVEAMYAECVKLADDWLARTEEQKVRHEHLEARAHEAFGQHWFMRHPLYEHLEEMPAPKTLADAALEDQRKSSKLEMAKNMAEGNVEKERQRYELEKMPTYRGLSGYNPWQRPQYCFY